MLSNILYQSSRQCFHINNFIRFLCTNKGSIVKIGDKCYVPVPCPKDEAPDTTATGKYIRITRTGPGKVCKFNRYFTIYYPYIL